MTAIKYRELKRRYELDGPQQTTAHISEALRKKQLRSEDFSLRDLAEALVPDGHRVGPATRSAQQLVGREPAGIR